MGYSTDFKGELKFSRELKASELAKLTTILGEDCRDHPEWQADTDLYYVNLELLPDFSGLRWDGCEKTNDLDRYVNLILKLMRQDVRDFGLEGKMLAQGEDIDDRWEFTVKPYGIAERRDLPKSGRAIRCPHCEEKVYVDDAEDWSK